MTGRRVSRALIGLIALVVGFGSAPAASSADGSAFAASSASAWTLTPTRTGWQLTWHGETALVVGATPLEVRAGRRLLGIAREVGTDAVVDLPTPPSSLQDLSLWRGAQRIDEPEPGGRRVPLRIDPPRLDRAPISPVDPGTPGGYRTRRLRYALEGLDWSEYVAPIEVVGEVTVPIGAPGARPLVLILHGRHSTCYQGGPDGEASLEWPCPAGWLPIPSHLGYRTTSDLLASQGYVVVSISANGVNAQDWVSADGGAAARSQLIRHHLATFARWNADGTDPWRGRLRGRVDLGHVVLIGHSRGGEGVARAAIDSRRADPWRIRGLVPIGPTAFGAQVPNDVHVAVLLPYCDGDVSDLQGQLYVDGARDLLDGLDPSLRSAVMVYGANHNFFNAEWTPGLAVAPAWDDWYAEPGDRSWCSPHGPNRLTPIQQQRVGATYSAALVRLALHRDRRMLDLLDGPASGPASTGHAQIRSTAIGGDRHLLWRSTKRGAPVGRGGLRVEYCRGLHPRPLDQCNPGSPHWPWGETPTLSTHHLAWNDGGTARFATRGANLRDRDRLELRVAMGVETRPVALRIRLVDRRGRTFVVDAHPSPLGHTPGPFGVRKAWARALRVDLDRVPRGAVDLGHIDAIELITSGSGDAWAFDMAAVGDTVPHVTPRFLPLIDIERVEAPEGDEPNQTIDVPVRIVGHFDRPIRATFAVLDDNFNTTWRTITIEPGTRTLRFPIAYDGDTRPLGDRDLSVLAYAHRDALTRNYIGGAKIVDDEEWPLLSVVDPTPTGSESAGIQIEFRTTHPVDMQLDYYASFLPPDGLPEIDSLDVSAETWNQWVFETPREPPTTPSSAFGFVHFTLEPNQTAFTLTIPFVRDGVVEGPEAFRLQFFDGLEETFYVDATVTD